MKRKESIMKPPAGSRLLDRREFIAAAVAGAAVFAGTVAGFPGTARAQATAPAGATASAGAPPFKLPELPYPETGLEPYISSRTLSFHYGKHHQAYLDSTNRLVKGDGHGRLVPGGSGETFIRSEGQEHLQQCRTVLEPCLLLEMHETEGRGLALGKTVREPFQRLRQLRRF